MAEVMSAVASDTNTMGGDDHGVSSNDDDTRNIDMTDLDLDSGPFIMEGEDASNNSDGENTAELFEDPLKAALLEDEDDDADDILQSTSPAATDGEGEVNEDNESEEAAEVESESSKAKPVKRTPLVSTKNNVSEKKKETFKPPQEKAPAAKPTAPSTSTTTATTAVAAAQPSAFTSATNDELAIPSPKYDFFGKAVQSVVGMARANTYDLCVSRVTKDFYGAMLEELEPGSVILDVGIGTATPLVHHRLLLNKKNIRVIGIDIDDDYLAASKIHIQKASLANRIRVYKKDVYEMDQLKGKIVLPLGVRASQPEEVLFDAILFSGTFPLLEDKVGALNALVNWQKPNCKIIICQAAQYESPLTPLARMFKPMLFYLTSVDHGKLITEDEARDLFELTIRRECKLDVTYHEPLEDYHNLLEAAYMTILEPMSARDVRINAIAARIN